MSRSLSSRWTFFYKTVFPVAWISGFALGTLALFTADPTSWHPSAPPPEVRWLFLGATVMGSLGLYWFCMRLKVVSLDGDVLTISSYSREIQVSLSDVERVSGSILLHPELIWLHFRRPTDFGVKVVFMPPVRFLSGYTRPPLVAELEALIKQASR